MKYKLIYMDSNMEFDEIEPDADFFDSFAQAKNEMQKEAAVVEKILLARRMAINTTSSDDFIRIEVWLDDFYCWKIDRIEEGIQ